ncbi:MAG TPA: hypothetical protein VLU54_05435 [Casimicrobiaceae bacterium]|nr:hypothetical protein [Casimicrobiaceae bacterium]
MPYPSVAAQRVALGAEGLYKVYAESFRGAEHRRRIEAQAQAIAAAALAAAA